MDPGSPLIKSENAYLNNIVYVDVRGRDIGGYARPGSPRVARDPSRRAGEASLTDDRRGPVRRDVEEGIVALITLLESDRVRAAGSALSTWCSAG